MMNFLSDIYKKTGTLHHAYALEGEKMNIVPSLFKFLEKDFGVRIKNNPDFLYQEFETFAIDDSRNLRELHGRRAISGKKIFIISTRFVTIEAQNSLLKIFEEPDEGAHFFLIMPNTQILIPTLCSRLVIVGRAAFDGTDLPNDSEAKSLAKKFLSMNIAERLILVKDIVEEKDKGKAIDFVVALEEALTSQLNVGAGKNKKDELTENADTLAEILTVKKYLHDRAPSIKLLLEYLCLSVTITKS
jgi:DNA polymerase III, delta subunit